MSIMDIAATFWAVQRGYGLPFHQIPLGDQLTVARVCISPNTEMHLFLELHSREADRLLVTLCQSTVLYSGRWLLQDIHRVVSCPSSIPRASGQTRVHPRWCIWRMDNCVDAHSCSERQAGHAVEYTGRVWDTGELLPQARIFLFGHI